MSGNAATNPSSSEKFLGVDSNSKNLHSNRKPLFGVLSLAVPILAFASGIAIGSITQKQDGSGAAWVSMPFIWTLALSSIATVVGLGLAVASLWRLEKCPWIAMLAIILESGYIFYLVRIFYR